MNGTATETATPAPLAPSFCSRLDAALRASELPESGCYDSVEEAVFEKVDEQLFSRKGDESGDAEVEVCFEEAPELAELMEFSKEDEEELDIEDARYHGATFTRTYTAELESISIERTAVFVDGYGMATVWKALLLYTWTHEVDLG